MGCRWAGQKRNTTTYLARETQRHREEHAAGSALDAAPPSGGRGVPTANERPLDRGSVVRVYLMVRRLITATHRGRVAEAPPTRPSPDLFACRQKMYLNANWKFRIGSAPP